MTGRIFDNDPKNVGTRVRRRLKIGYSREQSERRENNFKEMGHKWLSEARGKWLLVLHRPDFEVTVAKAGPLHLAQGNFSGAKGCAIHFTLVDPVNNEAFVNEETDVGAFFNQRDFMYSFAGYVDSRRTFVDDMFAWVFSKSSDGASGQLWIMRIIGDVVIP